MNGLFSPALAAVRKKAVKPFLQGRVLDFGCGVGRLCDLVGPDMFVGVDADETVLAEARLRNPGYIFQHVDTLRDAGGFDTIVAMAVIGYFDDLPELFGRFAGSLNPAGRIVVTSPTRMAVFVHRAGQRLKLFGDDAYETVAALPQGREFDAATAAAGLRVTRLENFMFGMNQLVIIAR